MAAKEIKETEFSHHTTMNWHFRNYLAMKLGRKWKNL